MRRATIGSIFKQSLRLDASQWIALGAVCLLWVVALLLVQHLTAEYIESSSDSAWWPYARTALAGAAVTCATLVTLQKRLTKATDVRCMLIRILAALLIVLAGMTSQALVPSLYELAAQSPVSPSILTLAALLVPAVVLALFGPSVPAAMDGPRTPWSAIRLGFALTSGLRLKLSLLVISWSVFSFAFSGLLVWSAEGEYRSFLLAAKELLLLPPVLLMALLYLERTSEEQDPVATVFG